MKTNTLALLVLILLVAAIGVALLGGWFVLNQVMASSASSPSSGATQNNTVPSNNAPAQNNPASPTNAPAQNNPASPTNAPAQTNIMPEQAQKIAEAAHPGARALGAEADHVIINNIWVDIYEIELDNNVDVAVDMKTGKIIATKQREGEW